MKRIRLFFLPLLLLLTCATSCVKEDDFDYEPEPDSYTVTVWSNFKGAPISVYINNSYRGQITSYYKNGSPSCDASGCVSVDFSTTGSYTYSANDGTHTWSGTGYVSSSCNTLNLTL